jgi:hypothetical protein
MRYIGNSIMKPGRKQFVETNLQTLFSNVIVPDIGVTDEEIEEFETEPDTYLGNDLEEADLQTRRRNALKFLTKLNSIYREQIMDLVNSYARELIGLYG